MASNSTVLAAAVAAAVTSLFSVGCASTEDLAPLPPAPSAGQSTLEGRKIYITCAGACHSPEPVLKYPRAEWLAKIVPEMSHEAKLRPDQIAALESYIRAVCPR